MRDATAGPTPVKLDRTVVPRINVGRGPANPHLPRCVVRPKDSIAPTDGAIAIGDLTRSIVNFQGDGSTMARSMDHAASRKQSGCQEKTPAARADAASGQRPAPRLIDAQGAGPILLRASRSSTKTMALSTTRAHPGLGVDGYPWHGGWDRDSPSQQAAQSQMRRVPGWVNPAGKTRPPPARPDDSDSIAHFGKALVDIPQDVVERLDPNGQADQFGEHAAGPLLRFVHLPVGRRGRVDDERLGVANVG